MRNGAAPAARALWCGVLSEDQEDEGLGDIAARLGEVRGRVAAAARRAGRGAGEVRLIAVSKGKPAEAIRAAYAAGQRDFGENQNQKRLNHKLKSNVKKP